MTSNLGNLQLDEYFIPTMGCKGCMTILLHVKPGVPMEMN